MDDEMFCSSANHADSKRGFLPPMAGWNSLKRNCCRSFWVCLTSAVLAPSLGAELLQDDVLDDYLSMNLEELLSVEITSVGKKKQQLKEAAAAVFVISSEDIRRSGVTSIPEALRLVPGLQVARINANKWAISSRGFNAEFSNKLLVLMDGRSIYSSSYSGVYWEDQDMVLEDIDRIEVIRGPGATLWGANAVNGVINIITKPADLTQGGLLQVSTGNEEKAIAQLRYGTTLGDDVAARAYLKFADRDSSYSPDIDEDANDEWRSKRGGFRMDGENNLQHWTIQGDVYHNEIEQIIRNVWLDPFDPANNPPDFSSPYRLRNAESEVETRGHNLLGRWSQSFSNDSMATLQVYYDHAERQEDILNFDIDTYDIDFEHRYKGFAGHDVLWGLGYRRIDDNYEGGFQVNIHNPSTQTNELFNGFLQDEISLFEDQLRVTLGTKLEHNNYTGMEVQPNAKFLWLADPRFSFWGSVARAARTPSAIERRGSITLAVIPLFPPVIVSNDSDGRYETEKVNAFELGVKFQTSETTSIDLAVFRNEYSDVATFEPVEFITVPDFTDPTGPPLTVTPTFFYDNKMEVTSEGAELVFDWLLSPRWRVQTSYSYINLQARKKPGSGDPNADRPIEGGTPENYLSLRSSYDVTDAVEFDIWLYYVDELKATRLSSQDTEGVDDYLSFNLRIGWAPIDDMELSLVGQNLLDSQHLEFQSDYVVRAETERSVYAQLKVVF